MNNKIKNGKIVACLDMGSSKLVCIIASIDDDEVRIIGYGHKEAKGMIGSVITDMRLAQKSIIGVVSQAERMAGLNIEEILVSISANQTKSFYEIARTKISSDSVRNCDILSLTEKVRLDFKKNNQEVIHLIPLEYNIDNSYSVDNPRYMSGSELSAKFHVISAPRSIIQNIENCLKKCQISVNSYVVDCYASSLSCLNDTEKNLRTLLIDIGSHFTSFCLYSESKLAYINCINLGGFNLTKDVATILNLNIEEAEKIKNLNSSLIINSHEKKELIKLGFGNYNRDLLSISRDEFREIIQSRLEEVFFTIKSILERQSIQIDMISNIVLTGGATASVGIDKIVSNIFAKNVRIGYPTRYKSVINDIFNSNNCCSFGMINFLYAIHKKELARNMVNSQNSWFKKLFDKVVNVSQNI